MKKPLVIILSATALLALSTACIPKEERKPEEAYPRPKGEWPKPTEPPPASPVYHDVDEWIATEEDIARADRDHNTLLTQEIEEALTTKDLVRRENAFVYLVPELLQVEPQSLVALHAKLKAGPERDLLRQEMAQIWSSSNTVAAARWMRSLDDDELRRAALEALTTLAEHEPFKAISLADDLGLAKDEGVRKLLAPLRRIDRSAD
jgi:hypothetical protein